MASETPAPNAPPVDTFDDLALDYVKDYLRVTDNVENDKIEGMIPRARLWVEEHTGLAIIQRAFTELHYPRAGAVRLYRGPLVTLGAIGWTDSNGVIQVFDDAVATPPSTKLTGPWPSTGGAPFQVTYTAGLWLPPVPSTGIFPPSEIDPRLMGAMLALIEGEYSAGFAYPDDTITAATNCLFYMKFVAP